MNHLAHSCPRARISTQPAAAELSLCPVFSKTGPVVLTTGARRKGPEVRTGSRLHKNRDQMSVPGVMVTGRPLHYLFRAPARLIRSREHLSLHPLILPGNFFREHSFPPDLIRSGLGGKKGHLCTRVSKFWFVFIEVRFSKTCTAYILKNGHLAHTTHMVVMCTRVHCQGLRFPRECYTW